MQHNSMSLAYPEGIYLFDGKDAENIETSRANCLTIFHEYNYEYIVFPIVDYADSLLTERDKLLAKDTHVLTDRISGKPLGIRADITPQAMKLDASRRQSDNPKIINRFCYADMTLQSKPVHWKQGRQIMQIGAELFGVDSIEGDIEIVQIVLHMLQELGITKCTIDIGHVSLYTALADILEINEKQKRHLFDLLQQKKNAELETALDTMPLEKSLKQIIQGFACTFGDGKEIITRYEALANKLPKALKHKFLPVLEDVTKIHDAIQDFTKRQNYTINLHIDLCELKGYQYKSGLLFTIYHHACNHPLVLGGRYDNNIYPPMRAATGFSANLLLLAQYAKQKKQ